MNTTLKSISLRKDTNGSVLNVLNRFLDYLADYNTNITAMGNGGGEVGLYFYHINSKF
jgi:hypothetical protein